MNPFIQLKIGQAHEAVSRGALADLQKIIADEPKKKLALAKDQAGIPLLHKAVYHDHQDVVEWLLNDYPNTAGQKDRVNLFLRNIPVLSTFPMIFNHLLLT